MLTFAFPALLVLAMSGTWLWLRFRPAGWRMAATIIAWAGLGLVLLQAGESPLLTSAAVPMGPPGHWLRAVGIFWWLCSARLLAQLARWLLARDGGARRARIAGDLASGLIYLATFLVILDFVLRLPVGGMVATSGIVAVVIGLALQNTLADVFSGIAVGIEGPFSSGDRITLADGVEGVVVEINWRSIRIETDGGDVAIVPNSNVAKTLLVNRSVPTLRRAVRVVLVCPERARPENVLEMLRRAAMLTPQVLETPAPVVGMTRLGARSATYAIDFFVADTAAIGRSRSGVLEQVHRQMRHADIAAQTVGMSEQAAGRRFLDELPLFAGLSGDQRDAIATTLRRRKMRSDTVVFAKDDEADTLVLIVDGVIAVTGTLPDTPSTVLRYAGAGEAIGDIALLAGEKRPYTARAMTPGMLFTISRDDLLRLVAQDESLAEALEGSAADHVELLRHAEATDTVPTHHAPHIFSALRQRLRRATGPSPIARS